MRKGVDDFLRDSLAEIFLITTLAEIKKRQNCDGRRGGSGVLVPPRGASRSHFSNKTVAAFGNGLYIRSVVAFLSQGLSKQEHRLREVPFLDKGVRPYALKNYLALH